jgi:FkbM family methyltransferase
MRINPRLKPWLIFGAILVLVFFVAPSMLTDTPVELHAPVRKAKRQTEAPMPAKPKVQAPSVEFEPKKLSEVQRKLQAMNKTLYDESLRPYETKLRNMMDTSLTQHAIAARFPLPELPLICMVKNDKNGDCLIGKACEEAKMPASKWNPDTHVRDIVISLLLECALPWGPKEPCVVHDIGANIGLIALTMAKMGAHVIAVEPQVDLCVALRTTLELNGELDKHLVFCGGVGLYAKGRLATSTGLYRYEGAVPAQVVAQYPKDVPLYNVASITGDFKKIKFAKIDTDSHDCLILEQYLGFIEKGELEVESLILETWDWSCGGGKIGEQLFKFSNLGYEVYRTLTPRDFDDNGVDTRNHFQKIDKQTPDSVEQYHQRMIRHTWKLNKRSKEEWVKMVQMEDQKGQIYFITKTKILELGYISK